MDINKICIVCKQCKPIEQFRRTKITKKFGQRYTPRCLDCLRAKEIVDRERKSLKVKVYAEEKTCCMCHKVLKIENFYHEKASKTGYGARCKSCSQVRRREIQQKISNSSKISIEGKVCSRCKTYKLKDCYSKYNLSVDGFNHYCKICVGQMHGKYKENINKKRRERFRTDPTYLLIHNLRRRMNHVIKGESKSAKSIELLGCTGAEWMDYLEGLFWPGMNRFNQGRNGWAIDHIIPIEAFDKTDPQWQFKCFHYTNTQPLWKEDNEKKKARLDWTPRESKFELPERLKKPQ